MILKHYNESYLQFVLRHRDSPMVHVGHQSLQHLQLNVIENKNRVAAGVVLQDLLKIWAAGGQDHFVALQVYND